MNRFFFQHMNGTWLKKRETLGSDNNTSEAVTSNVLDLSTRPQPAGYPQTPPPNRKKLREESKSETLARNMDRVFTTDLDRCIPRLNPQLLRQKKKSVLIQDMTDNQIPQSVPMGIPTTVMYPSHPMYPPMHYQSYNHHQPAQPQSSPFHPKSFNSYIIICWSLLLLLSLTLIHLMKPMMSPPIRTMIRWWQHRRWSEFGVFSFQICAREQLQQLLINMCDEDCEFNYLWPIPHCYESTSSDTDTDLLLTSTHDDICDGENHTRK